MQPKHTPGPWKWHPKSTVQEHNGSVYGEPHEGHAYAVAMQPRYVSDEQWAADARLIAAAPELLATLIEIMRAVPRVLRDEGLLVRVDDAIAKATGSSG